MADHQAIFDSELFTFICGPDEKRVIVHSYAVTSGSEVLKAMVTNGMKDTGDKTARLPGVSGRVFQLFSAWCYSGAYRSLSIFQEKNKADDTTAAASPCVEFEKRSYPTEGMSHQQTRVYLRDVQPPDPPTNLVSVHAELLHKDLVILNLNEETVVDVAKMLEFTYTNTSSDDEPGGPGVEKDLRDLVVAYTKWKAGELIKLGAFRAMMSKGGEFVGELITPALFTREQ